ncbi:MAG: hypothetical protein L0154_29970 [Chloroflexi bacterium]|nr:hypothetical protein [Chloroflexota bacterium]
MFDDNARTGMRLGGTLLIWVMMAIMITPMARSPHIFNLLAVTIIAGVGLISTLAIWDQLGFLQGDTDSSKSYSKRKNENRDAEAALLLLQMLSPEERDTIRNRLMDNMRNDGEIPGIDENTEMLDRR